MHAMSLDFPTLKSLLQKRLAVIGDHALRDADPASHLKALQEVSEAIETEHQRLRGSLPGRLRHFLEQASYQKALALLEDGGTGIEGPH